MAKEICFGNEARKKVKRGIDIVCDAVKPTLGAVGKSVIIGMGGLDPIFADDGVTVARSIELKDQWEQLGNKIIQRVGLRQNKEAGDGTSTSMVLAQAFVEEAMKEIGDDGSKIREVNERLQKGLRETLDKLTAMKSDVKDSEIEQTATIASLDPEIGKLIAKCFLEVGRDGVVTIEDSQQIGYTSEIVKGMKFEKGLSTPYFINEPDKERCVLENPYILITDRRIATNSQIKNILEKIVASGRTNLLIIALNVEGEALASLVMNHQRRALNVACVQAPYSLNRQKDFLTDLAILTGATVVSEEAGLFLDKVDLSVLGSAEKVTVTMGETTIVNGSGSPEAITERVTALKSLLADKDNEYDKKLVSERIASLTGGIGVIRVGAFTETELRAKKFKIEDAVNATKAALEEGIVAGGGTPFAKIAARHSDPMFQKALITPLRQMAINAGMDWYKIVSDVQHERFDIDSTNFGYDFKAKEYKDLVSNGIIDPFKVSRLALESAVSIASTMVQADVAMVELPKEEIKNE